MQECLLLTKSGVPWHVVMEMDAVERRGFCIAVGLSEGHVFDWNSLRWSKSDA